MKGGHLEYIGGQVHGVGNQEHIGGQVHGGSNLEHTWGQARKLLRSGQYVCVSVHFCTQIWHWIIKDPVCLCNCTLLWRYDTGLIKDPVCLCVCTIYMDMMLDNKGPSISGWQNEHSNKPEANFKTANDTPLSKWSHQLLISYSCVSYPYEL